MARRPAARQNQTITIVTTIHIQCMVHQHPTDCKGTIEFTDNWEPITYGVYRNAFCTVCGRQFNEYYTYKQLETAEETDDEKIIIYRR